MNTIQALRSVLKGEVENDTETLLRYSRDASVFEVKPRLVVFPKDAQDLKHLISFLWEHAEERLSLTARGAGTDMSGGPLSESIILDMTRHFNRIKEVGSNYAVVEPGVYYRELATELEKRNLLLPCFPASKDLCTVGGMVGNNAGGEKTLRYGQTNNYVEELKVVFADGNEYVVHPVHRQELDKKMQQNDFEGSLYKKVWDLIQNHREALANAKPNVSKNSSGYALWNVWDQETQVFDLTQLLVGSQGTLGIITEIRFRLIQPSPGSKALLVMFLPSLEPLVETVKEVLQHNPETLESFDDHTLKFALRFFWDFVKVLKTRIFSVVFQFLPEFFMVLRGVPKLVLLAEFAGTLNQTGEEKANAAKERVETLGVQARVVRKPMEMAKYMAIRRESFNLLQKHPGHLRSAPFIDDVIVRPEFLEEFLPKLKEILAQYPNLIYTIAGHMGDGNFHIIPLMNLRTGKDRMIIPELAAKVYSLVFQYKGSMSAEHNDGIVRTPFLQDMYGKEVTQLFLEMKRIFDIANIFNPGKKVSLSMEYLLSHIIKT